MILNARRLETTTNRRTHNFSNTFNDLLLKRFWLYQVKIYGKLFLDKSFFPKSGMPVSELGELSRAVFINRENELKKKVFQKIL